MLHPDGRSTLPNFSRPSGLGTSAANLAESFQQRQSSSPTHSPPAGAASAEPEVSVPVPFLPGMALPGLTLTKLTQPGLALPSAAMPLSVDPGPAAAAVSELISSESASSLRMPTLPGLTLPSFSLPGLSKLSGSQSEPSKPTSAKAASSRMPSGDPAYAMRTWGDGTASPLYCPITVRFNEPLAEEVDERLVEWASECGFNEDEQKKVRKTRFGRLVTLAHPDCEDPDRLLIGAKLNMAWWAADDYYADDSALGAEAQQLPARLMLAMAAMDPVPPAGEFSQPLHEAIDAERVLVALRSGLKHMGRYATPEQVQRTCYATFAMFVSWCAYAAWRHTGEYPPAWKYLAARQHDSFYTSMTLVDVIGGYQLPPDMFYDPRIRQAAFQAGTAVVLVNDLYSVNKDLCDEKPPANMVLQVAADRHCSIEEATEVVVELHNQLVHDFEDGHRALMSVPHLELQRFMRGLRSWMGGAFEWHDSNPRYRVARPAGRR